MKFCHVTITVRNLDESIQFYRDVIGLSLRRQFPAGDNLEIAFLGSGETEVELICNRTGKNVDICGGITLGFEVESVSEAAEFLRRKDIEPGEPIQLGTQAQCLYISDPDGMRIQLIEYLK